MTQLPIFLTVDKLPCLIVGGGPIAARKARPLLQAGAKVTVVSPTLVPQLQHFLNTKEIAHSKRKFYRADLTDIQLVIAATDDPAVNTEIADLAKEMRVLCNVADKPNAGNFSLPSIVNRDPLLVAISSSGTSPVLSRILKTRLEAFIPKNYGALAKFAGEFRSEVKEKISSLKTRRQFWESALSGAVAELVLNGREAEAKAELKGAIDIATQRQDTTVKGEVYLVGAGPGNPDLLTFRALRLIQQADVVLHDRLVAPAIVNLCRESAERVYVGKRRADHSMPQTDINQTLINYAKQGKRVLRLKGGDPFIFGRGGEEIESLAEHNIPFQVVPGITAASGCASYAGIPLTHRDHAQSCTFFTGHLKDGSVDLPWDTLTDTGQTLVCYMGLVGLPVICSQLIEHGMAADTPAALIERGTTTEQKVHIGTVTTLPSIISGQKVTAPTLIIIGSVVTLHKQLSWLPN